MVHGQTISTQANPSAQQLPPTPEEQCKLDGGVWDVAQQFCILPFKDVPKPEVGKAPKGAPPPVVPEVFRSRRTGNVSGVDLPSGQTFLGLSPDEVAEIAARESGRGVPPPGAVPVGTSAEVARQQAAGTALAGQIGQISPSDTTPTEGLIPGVSLEQSAIQGAVGSIPSAIRQAGTFAAGAAIFGGTVGSVVPGAGTAIGAGAGAAIGAAVGFTSGIVAGMISETSRQRTDNVNAQQRVLDEGKQTLMDWVTIAKSDPSQRMLALAQFNVQLQKIQDAHVEMITDTNGDVLKFESAVPNLAEFNTFYSTGGERDALVVEMQLALRTPSSPEWEMIQLARRRT